MKPRARTSGLVVQESKQETLIYDLERNKAFCLNETSALVMKHCDGGSDISDITAKINSGLNAAVTDEAVWLALNQLDQEGLLEDFDNAASTFDGLSRRQIIKRVGFGSMVGLPVVASVIAPSAVFAQSCVGAGTAAPGAIVGQTACPSTGPTCTACSPVLSDMCCTGNSAVDTPSCAVPGTTPTLWVCDCVCA